MQAINDDQIPEPAEREGPAEAGPGRQDDLGGGGPVDRRRRGARRQEPGGVRAEVPVRALDGAEYGPRAHGPGNCKQVD